MANSAALTEEVASKFVRIALGHVAREFPYAPGHVMTGPEDFARPAALHPVFHGSFDWHSCVHGYWLLARVYRRFPDMPEGEAIALLFNHQFTEEKIAGELAYVTRASARTWERPYGWAWLLMLAGELMRNESGEGTRWSRALQPLAEEIVKRFRAYLPLADYPVRAGVHSNTALALTLALDYAAVTEDDGLAHAIAQKALAWYGGDENCQAWEPSQDDFLSSALSEASLMADILGDAFHIWFTRFLPRAAQAQPSTLFTPAKVSDRTDGKIAHLDGLNLSRAWCWRRIARLLSPSDGARAQAEDAAARHLESAIEQVAGDYMGEHWLASFALLALDPWP
ncbi:MAG: DUF2891 domain-containing protein, partial [Alphaproteobacteria bacterium]